MQRSINESMPSSPQSYAPRPLQGFIIIQMIIFSVVTLLGEVSAGG